MFFHKNLYLMLFLYIIDYLNQPNLLLTYCLNNLRLDYNKAMASLTTSISSPLAYLLYE